MVDRDYGATRGVNQERSRPHAPEHALVDHAARLVVERRVHAHRVALLEERAQVSGLDIRREVAVDEVGVAGNDALERVARDMPHALADAAETDDPERHLAGASQPSR